MSIRLGAAGEGRASARARETTLTTQGCCYGALSRIVQLDCAYRFQEISCITHEFAFFWRLVVLYGFIVFIKYQYFASRARF